MVKTVEQVAAVKGLPFEAVAAASTANARRLFRL
jgi:Tat protein secretion system quality control protein TatD with DNase activity